MFVKQFENILFVVVIALNTLCSFVSDKLYLKHFWWLSIF